MPRQDARPYSSSGSEALIARYRAVRSARPTPGRVAVLSLGADETGVAVGASDEPEATVLLGIGSRKTAGDHFKQTPPSPGDLETAIMVVEDEVSRVLGLLQGSPELVTAATSIREIVLATGQRADTNVVLSLEQVERTFDRLAAVSLGRPAAREGLPSGNDFAATLLIVREFMHHLGFSRITILA